MNTSELDPPEHRPAEGTLASNPQSCSAPKRAPVHGVLGFQIALRLVLVRSPGFPRRPLKPVHDGFPDSGFRDPLDIDDVNRLAVQSAEGSEKLARCFHQVARFAE